MNDRTPREDASAAFDPAEQVNPIGGPTVDGRNAAALVPPSRRRRVRADRACRSAGDGRLDDRPLLRDHRGDRPADGLHLVAGRRGPAPGDGPAGHARNRHGVLRRRGAALLGALRGDQEGNRPLRRLLLHRVGPRRDRSRRRRPARDRRHAGDHRRGHPDLRADRDHGRRLPERVRQGPLAKGAHLLRRRDDGHPVDRRGALRLCAVRRLPRAGHPPRHHRVGRPDRADDPDRDPLRGGDPEDRPGPPSRGRLRARDRRSGRW